jgi:hypothetical protein
VARSFPSNEKWQQTTLFVLARAFATSVKPNPATKRGLQVSNLALHPTSQNSCSHAENINSKLVDL